MKSSSAATPVTISGVTSGSRVTAPTTRPRRDRIRSRPSASIVPSTSEPSAATVAIRRLAHERLEQRAVAEEVGVPPGAEAGERRQRLLVVEAEQRHGQDRQVEPGEERDGDRDGEQRLALQPPGAASRRSRAAGRRARAGRPPSARSARPSSPPSSRSRAASSGPRRTAAGSGCRSCRCSAPPSSCALTKSPSAGRKTSSMPPYSPARVAGQGHGDEGAQRPVVEVLAGLDQGDVHAARARRRPAGS